METIDKLLPEIGQTSANRAATCAERGLATRNGELFPCEMSLCLNECPGSVLWDFGQASSR